MKPILCPPKIAIAVAILLPAFSGLISCTVDHRYDLDLIDDCIENGEFTLFEKGIVIPVGETPKFTLDSLAGNIGESGGLSDILKVDKDGNYRMEKGGTLDLSSTFNKFNISELLKIDEFCTENIFTTPLLSYEKAAQSIPIPSGFSFGKLYTEIEDSQDFDAFSNLDISDIVVGIGRIELDNVTINPDVTIGGLPDIGTSSFVVDIDIQLPDYLEPNIIHISGAVEQKNGTATLSSVQPVPISGLNLENVDINDLRTDKGVSGTIKINGSVSADEVRFDPSTVGKELTFKVRTGFKGKDGELAIKKAQAKLDCSMDNTAYVSLDGFAGKDGAVNGTADFPDVNVSTIMKSNTSIPLEISAKIFEMKNNVINTQAPLINRKFAVPYSIDGTVRTVEDSFSFDFNPVMNNHDDSLAVCLSTNTDKTKYVQIDGAIHYQVEMDYTASIPLSLGKGFSMKQADTLEVRIDKSAGSIITSNSLGLSARIENTFPVGIDAVFSFLQADESGEKFTEIPLESPCFITIGPDSQGEMQLVFSPKAEAAAMTLTHVCLSLSLSGSDEVVNNADFIQLKDIYIYAENGITFNAGQFNAQK